MKDFEIAGHHIRLDFGAMKIMGKQTGLDALDPMGGITDNEAVLATIMYGGMARVDVKAERPVSYSYDEVLAMLDDFSQGDLAAILDAWNQSKVIETQKKSE